MNTEKLKAYVDRLEAERLRMVPILARKVAGGRPSSYQRRLRHQGMRVARMILARERADRALSSALNAQSAAA